jgi:hypothetical protein
MMRFYLATIFLVFASHAQAGDLPPLATGEQIKKAVTGNTVEGSMQASGRYTEFYAKDGTVSGKDYKAVWRIEGDAMCWIYKDQPKDCWRASIKGATVQWVKNNKVQGTGTIVTGNINNF